MDPILATAGLLALLVLVTVGLIFAFGWRAGERVLYTLMALMLAVFVIGPALQAPEWYYRYTGLALLVPLGTGIVCIWLPGKKWWGSVTLVLVTVILGASLVARILAAG
jgi:hypothetical protein